jgi:hypothetical protein
VVSREDTAVAVARPSRLCLAAIGSAESLAMFRMALAAVVLRTPEIHDAERWSDVPASSA